MLHFQRDRNSRTFFLNCKDYDKERAKLEKHIKKIFYKNNYHKLSITIENLLGEYDLSSLGAAIIRKNGRVYSGKGKRNLKLKHENTVIKLFVFRLLFIYVFIYLLILFYLHFAFSSV